MTIDRVVFGDNQFFGINHRSVQKAQELSERFATIDAIMELYDEAFDTGIEAVMLNSNRFAGPICDRFRDAPERYGHLRWYPSIPYPHKYAALVAEHGIGGALKETVKSAGTAKSMAGGIATGGWGVMTKNASRLMRALVDMEMAAFRGLDIRVVFLQNVITDLMLGFGSGEMFVEFAKHVRDKYDAQPGFLTQNLPLLARRLEEWEVGPSVICASINRRGYLMSPDREAYEEYLGNLRSPDITVMAMSVLASGAIPPREAIEYVSGLGVDSVVFGASRRAHIEQTLGLLSS